MLVIFAGLPATGKTTIARELARRLGAVYLRIDSIEQAIRASRTESGATDVPIDDQGYRVAYSLAEDNLRLGRTVVADSVNPLQITREAWLAVARRANTPAIEIEVICSDPKEHKRRVKTRLTDVPGLKLPTWEDVLSREYHAWHRNHIVFDTATSTADECVAKIEGILLAHAGA